MQPPGRLGILVLTMISCSVQGQGLLPGDVTLFVKSRDLCDHFRGEEPFDAERRKFLQANMRKVCTGSDSKLKLLRMKYRANSQVLHKLNEYEPQIEARGAGPNEGH